LQAVAVQVAAQSPFFEPEESLTDAATAHVVFPLSEVAGTHAAACRELLVSGDALSKGGGLHGSGVGFARQIVIGTYTGGDPDSFLSWFNKELYKMEKFLPSFSCSRLDVVEHFEDDSQEVLNTVALIG
jgi:hypothetical protein